MDSSSDCNLNRAAELIREEIAGAGVIPFARFMELALYHPEHGYYRQSHIGRSGDFFTSVSVGGLFGQLLAFWLADQLRDITGPVDLVEAGAHDGSLGRDIMGWLRGQRPELAERVQYSMVESSGDAIRGDFEINRVKSIEELPQIRGAIFANELLDAFPVRVYKWNRRAGKWTEHGVGSEAGSFVWAPMGAHEIEDLRALQEYLPDQFTVEFSTAAEDWWQKAALKLDRGLMAAMDYGDESSGLWTPDRSQGTLRSFRGHRVGANVLEAPGGQDITASVNFTRIKAAGERAGLVSSRLESQESFLGKIAAEFWQSPPGGGQFRQFQTLTHPEHLGRSFKVLTQFRKTS